MIDIKSRLTEFENNGWHIPREIDADTFVDELIDALASVDSDLREKALTACYYLIEAQGQLSDEKCRLLLVELISEERLLKGLGEVDHDSIFARAFYVYAIGNLMDHNKKVSQRIFTNEKILEAFEVVLRVFNEENDLRDYVPVKGWAHGVAHYGDNLGVFAEDDALEHQHLMAILDAIRNKICLTTHQYRGGEDRRLAAVVIKVLERSIVNEEEFSNWTSGFLTVNHELNALHYNVTNFLWSLRFALQGELKETYDKYVDEVNIKWLSSTN